MINKAVSKMFLAQNIYTIKENYNKGCELNKEYFNLVIRGTQPFIYESYILHIPLIKEYIMNIALWLYSRGLLQQDI
jgi:hypothetical protein